MIRIRLAGRGGQGTKIACDLIANMLYSDKGEEGKFPYVSATMTYGPERRGAPVDAFVRLSTQEIREIGPFGNPDMIIVLDGTLADDPRLNTAKDLKERGVLLINSERHPSQYAEYCKHFRVFTVDASGIALQYGLGTTATPIVNTALLGAFVSASGLGSIEILTQFIDSNMKKLVDANKRAAIAAYRTVQNMEGEQS